MSMIVQFGDGHSMDCWVKSGYDVHARDKEGKTALHHAAKNGAESVTDVLLDAGADANAQDVRGWTPLFYALREHELDVVDILLMYSDPSLRTNKRETALHVVLEYGLHGHARDVLEKLIEQGVDINACNADLETAFSISMRYFDVDSMEILMGVGSDVYIVGQHGINLLSDIVTVPMSVESKRPRQQEIHTKMGRTLIEAGNDVDGGDCAGFNPLVTCIRTGNCGLLKALLQANCETKKLRGHPLNCSDFLSKYLTDAYEEHYMHFASFLYVDCCCAPEDQHIQQIFFDFCGDHEESLRKEGLDLDRPPLSLTRLCRVALRFSLPRGRSFQSAVDQLPLPSLLKDFVGLQESPQ